MPLKTRQVYNLFQEPVEQPPLDFSIAEEKKLNGRFVGKTSLTKNFQMNFRGGGMQD